MSNLELIANGYKFRLVNKYSSEGYNYVKIESQCISDECASPSPSPSLIPTEPRPSTGQRVMNTFRGFKNWVSRQPPPTPPPTNAPKQEEKITEFLVYRSQSECGIFRLCLTNGTGRMIKGLDYTLTTLITMELQLFLFKHYKSIPIAESREDSALCGKVFDDAITSISTIKREVQIFGETIQYNFATNKKLGIYEHMGELSNIYKHIEELKERYPEIKKYNGTHVEIIGTIYSIELSTEYNDTWYPNYQIGDYEESVARDPTLEENARTIVPRYDEYNESTTEQEGKQEDEKTEFINIHTKERTKIVPPLKRMNATLYYFNFEGKVYSEKDMQIFPDQQIFGNRTPKPRNVESIYDIKNEIIPICIIPTEPVTSMSRVEKYGINSQYCVMLDNNFGEQRLKFSKILEYNDQMGVTLGMQKKGVSKDYGYNMSYYQDIPFITTLKDNEKLQRVWTADQERINEMVDEKGKEELESARQEAYANFGGKKTRRRKTKRGKKLNNNKSIKSKSKRRRRK